MVREDISRQVLLWGEESQERLEGLSVGIVGSGLTSQLLTITLLSLGVGRVTLISNERHPPGNSQGVLHEIRTGDSLVERISQYLSPLYPFSQIRAYHSPPMEAILYHDLPDILFNLSGGKWSIAELGSSYDRLWYEGGCYPGSVSLGREEEHFLPIYDGASAGLLAALCGEEVRKYVAPLKKNDELLKRGLIEISPLTKRITEEFQRKITPRLGEGPSEHRGKKARILLVGAGGIGGALGFLLSMDMVDHHMDIFDPDVVEASNLNRQFLYRGREGEKKAILLAQALQSIHAQGSFNAYTDKIDSDRLKDIGDYNLVLSAVDNLQTRAVLANYCMKKQIPLINGGTSSLGGSVQLQLPGNPCITCQGGLAALIEDRGHSEQAGCRVASPSVITPNMATASLMAMYATHILDGKILDPSPTVYHATANTRVVFLQGGNSRKECLCGLQE